MCDVDHASECFGFRQRELQMQLVADAERAVDFQPYPLFRQIDDFAGESLCSPPNHARSVNWQTKELALLGHGMSRFQCAAV